MSNIIQEVKANLEANKKNLRKYIKLDIGEVSLVEDPCCPGADVVIIKSKAALGSEGNSPCSDTTADRVVEWSNILKNSLNKPVSLENVRKSLSTGRDILYRIEELGPLNEFEEIQKGIIQEVVMDIAQYEEALKSSADALDAANETITKAKQREDALTAELEALKKGKAKKDCKSKDADPDDPNGTDTDPEEEIMKGLPAAAVELIKKSRTDAAEARKERDEVIQKQRDAADAALTTELVKKSKDWGAKDADGLGAALVAITKSNPEQAKIIQDNLDHLASQVDGKIFKSIGGAQGDKPASGGAKAEIDAKVESVRKAKPAITEAQAMTEVVQANPELYDRYKQELQG